MTDFSMPHISINKEEDLIASLDDVITDSGKWYRRYYALGIAVQIWGNYGGNWYVEGMRTNSTHEWQVATSYGHPIRHFVRSKYAGIWEDWHESDAGNAYQDISYQLTTDFSCTKHMYLESGMVSIYISVNKIMSGIYNIYMPSRYAPRTVVGGAIFPLDTYSDLGRILYAIVGMNGHGLIAITSDLAGGNCINISYPLRHK